MSAVFVLDPKLQDGKKIPKWNRCSRLGQVMGFSDEHSSLVANVRHLTTGFVSPQYHVVFDDLFETVFSSGYDDALVDTICNNLFEYNRDVYAEEEFDSSGNLIYHPPPLDEVWLDEPERRDRRERLRHQRAITEERERSKRLRVPAPMSPPEPFTDNTDDPPPMVVSDSGDDNSDDGSSAPSHQEGEFHASDGDLGGNTGGDFANEFNPGGNGDNDDEHDTVEHISPRYPRIN